MFDVAPTELLLVGVVALLIIGPKDLPRAMRLVGKWVGRARGVARQFRSGFDSMVREAELQELEKQWAAENARIMREHPPEALPAPEAEPAPAMTAMPEIRPDPEPAAPEAEVEATPAPAPAAKKPRKPRAPRKAAAE
ncbi:Sec-independent protein translocase protein TatB [Sphingomonas canadensis]|uniref:Sec-independent protein translocase protein TatB n=1 Tax=Sphingomonas canadensis TaxID=1219257 RepID=A0ABW3H3C8_9SPHN|nr:Sec-independent protein translocase protein TatB [Sphingomonas canadensis]MCW3835839.1 Sec-independent protein translocase protein TatB [Sphingomonas canadensis]